MNKLSRKPTQVQNPEPVGRYNRFFLKENPFPLSPVNKNSTDKRINGEIYEDAIRAKEYSQVENGFLKQPQFNLNRLRLGYIRDTSYIGRGNGKSAFLVNLTRTINKEFCLDISDSVNKCFALYVVPEAGGRTKTFTSFIELIFVSLVQSGIIDVCLASLRLDAAAELYPDIDLLTDCTDDELVAGLNSLEWLKNKGVEPEKLFGKILENDLLQSLPENFPIMNEYKLFASPFVTTEMFVTYFRELKKGQEQIEFIFSHLVQLLMASGFNGAYILVDDFERIPDFQTARQRKDFAIELRSCFLDGPYINARYGFYNILLVLHAGVPQLISEAWQSSGLDNRYPLLPKIDSKHLIKFEKLSNKHVSMLLEKYLSIYRTGHIDDELAPFTQDAVLLIARNNENNAARILKTCSELLEKAADSTGCTVIDEDFVKSYTEGQGLDDMDTAAPAIEDQKTTDLMQKAAGN